MPHAPRKVKLLMDTLVLCLVLLCLPALVLSAASPPAAAEDSPAKKVVIAHRGASGYLPEHTLPAKALAHAMGADFLEQDVVLTKDAVPIVLHDIHLDTVTDVAKVYPERARDDGRFYAIDFTLAEIRRLNVSERFDRETAKAVYANRFPVGQGSFSVPTLAEEIELVQGLNKSTGRDVGIYPEIKSPAWHRQQGHDISKIVLKVLSKYGYQDRDDNVVVQCFDAAECKRLRTELGTKLRLVQLIGENDWNEAATDYDHLRTAEGLKEIASYADGIGPWMPHLVAEVQGSADAGGGDPQTREAKSGRWRDTGLVKLAHDAGLVVHPYTFRIDSPPPYSDDFDEVLRIFFFEVGVDGIFTDFPDRAVKFLGTARDSKISR